MLDLGNWHEYLKCLQNAGYRSRRMISSESAALFSYALWLVGRIDFGMDLPTLRTVIARWFFMAHTTGRYTSSPESALEFDLGRISDLPKGDSAAFTAELERLIAANFTNDYWKISLPNRLETSSARSPTNRGRTAATRRTCTPAVGGCRSKSGSCGARWWSRSGCSPGSPPVATPKYVVDTDGLTIEPDGCAHPGAHPGR